MASGRPPTQRSIARSSARRRRVDSSRSDGLLIEIREIFLAEGFTTLTVDDLAKRLRCSKSTIYGIAPTKDQLVVAATKQFFRTASEEIEAAVQEATDSRERITLYLKGIAGAMHRNSAAFYDDMVSYAATAEIYAHNAEVAAQRVEDMIELGIENGEFRSTNGIFAAELVAIAIDSVQSGALLAKTNMSAAEAFAELGDLLLHGLLSR